MSLCIKKKSHCKDADKILFFLAVLLQFSSSAYTVFKVSPDFSNTHLCVCSSDSWDPRFWLILFLWCKVRKDYLASILVSCIARLYVFLKAFVFPTCVQSPITCVWLKHIFLRVSRTYLKMSKNQRFLQFL